MVDRPDLRHRWPAGRVPGVDDVEAHLQPTDQHIVRFTLDAELLSDVLYRQPAAQKA